MKKADRIYYGGDYNPDQWDDKTIEEDMRLFKKAGINLLTLPVFSWARLEPDEGVYCFEWLDRIIDKIWENGIYVCLATPTDVYKRQVGSCSKIPPVNTGEPPSGPGTVL